MFLKMAVLRAFYIGSHRENGQNQTFCRFEPLNGLFYANFIACPLEIDATDILAQFWEVENFVLGLGVPKRGQNDHFWPFSGKKGKFSHLGHPKLCFGG